MGRAQRIHYIAAPRVREDVMHSVLRLAMVFALLACAGSGGPSRRAARGAIEDGRLEEGIAMLEQRRDARPQDAETRNDLGEAYYRAARRALDDEQYDDYERYLELALAEWIESLRIDPSDATPHLWMGIVAAYQGDLDRALVPFKNARRLGKGNPIHDTNLAEIYVYRGELPKARRHLERGRRGGAPDVVLEITGSLAAWRAGDMVEARDLFASAYALDPSGVNNWNEAPVDRPIRSFEDFTGYCCSHVACGPYMRGACEKSKFDVAERKAREETLRRELVLEMERRRALEQIYRGRKDLKVEVEDAAEGAPESSP
jgi:tetratricopeptide (TPR) repeat protein